MNLFKSVLIIFFSVFLVLGTMSFADERDTKIPSIPTPCESGVIPDWQKDTCKSFQKEGGSTTEQISRLIKAVNSILIVAAPSIAVLAILFGAYRIMAKGFQAGIKIIQWALIGMVVVLLASGLLSIALRLFGVG
ncbi:MAG: hypothetical protein ACRCXZ_09435 [Patescibacteria group bacterium]